MKPRIYENSIVPRLLSWFFPVGAIVLWPFIFCRTRLQGVMRNHELIHFEQYRELWVIGFYAVYLYDWLRGLWKYKDTKKAYQQIRFEQEAYANQDKPMYYKYRNNLAWLRYKV